METRPSPATSPTVPGLPAAVPSGPGALTSTLAGVPYDKDIAHDHSREEATVRQRFVEQYSGITLRHVPQYSFDPVMTLGNIESFTGVAQVPLAFAGPLHVNGEHARGDFLIPLATSEGSLVASYNRGMKLLNGSGGVTCTVSADRMQRAPVFAFDSAREASAFSHWIQERMDDIRIVTEATSHVARLQRIETYLAHRFAFLRLDFSTGDAAGQNMVGKATLAACEWIAANNTAVRQYLLDSQFSSDKKVSYVNSLRTRGKRVTAEVTIPRALLWERMHVEPEAMDFWAGVASVGSHLAGAMSNGLHAPNALAAMFIATGQDVANVAEGSAVSAYLEVTKSRDLYVSVTIPSLIVATHGGGTHLATQRECLEIMGCYGTGKAQKLAEIIAGVVLAGEISLAAAICTREWVTAHEKFGRNR